MNPLHVDLLIALRAAGEYGVALEQLLADLRLGRHRELVAPDLQAALRDLGDTRFVSMFTSPLGQKRWRLTSLGGDKMKEAGL